MFIKKIVIIIMSISVLHSCFIGAGTIGKIEEYQFDFSKNELEQKIDLVINNNSNIEKQDSDEYYSLLVEKYGNNKSNVPEEDFRKSYAKYSYIAIIYKSEKYIFRFDIRGNSNSSSIILVSGNIYGRGIDVADNLDSKLKAKLSNIFKIKFIEVF